MTGFPIPRLASEVWQLVLFAAVLFIEGASNVTLPGMDDVHLFRIPNWWHPHAGPRISSPAWANIPTKCRSCQISRLTSLRA